ncbi:YozQ family protein [Aneurinibacillus sp. Ricciae_BoGa-3]|uniref:YozQ family protein n=1 Tax=Aneurinibacillus sp. Ricciae_BoGa-3 TaxID=3022697 RepID=UPI002341F639|nr:YozQ family protein [Aneurinibacillus sp. Ricciae_BoGa-3]WCK54421.1 YozQ family protein [Aneurinibacillus sp. Ricciae_BoGa-3]
MMKENQHDKELQQKSRQVADQKYPSAENKKDQHASTGMAKTHKQAADTLTEGTIEHKGGNSR